MNIAKQIHSDIKKSAKNLHKKTQDVIMRENSETTIVNEDAIFLKSIGFANVDFVSDLDKKNKQIEESIFRLNVEKENATRLQNRLDELKKRYPDTLIVTEDAIQNICLKYDLCFSASQFYTGSIPNQNIAEIKSFNDRISLHSDDILCVDFSEEYSDSFRRGESHLQAEFIKGKRPECLQINYQEETDNNGNPLLKCYYTHFYPIFYKYDKDTEHFRKPMNDYYIVAPISDFNIIDRHTYVFTKDYTKLKSKNKIQENYITVADDPIVVKPVYGYQHVTSANNNQNRWENKPLYMIVTMWGVEKYDPLLTQGNTILYDN